MAELARTWPIASTIFARPGLRQFAVDDTASSILWCLPVSAAVDSSTILKATNAGAHYHQSFSVAIRPPCEVILPTHTRTRNSSSYLLSSQVYDDRVTDFFIYSSTSDHTSRVETNGRFAPHSGLPTRGTRLSQSNSLLDIWSRSSDESSGPTHGYRKLLTTSMPSPMSTTAPAYDDISAAYNLHY